MIRLLTIAVIFAVLAGCGTPSDPTGDLGRRDLPQSPDSWRGEAALAAQVNNGWIANFDDETLDTLVAEAQANNRNLQAAATNVERAAALSRQAGAALKPAAALNLSTTSTGAIEGVGTTEQYQAGLQIDWKLDLWGRLQAGRKAADATLVAESLDLKFAQSSLAASVARSYFLAKDARQQAGIAEQTVRNLERIHSVVQLQFDEGVVSSQDLHLARSDLAASRSSLAGARQAERDALRALEVLIGRYPGANLDLESAFPAVPPRPPAGVPSEVLERRADLVAAERRIAAAFHQTDQAKTAQLPSISLTGNIGGASTSLQDVLNPANAAWRAAGSLLAPIFQSGALRAQIDAANADQKAAIAAYGQKALDVFAEVEIQLDTNETLAEQVREVEQAYRTAEEAFRIARLRHDNGDISLLELIQVEQRSVQRKSEWVALQRQMLEERVNLYLALGGDWE